MNLTPFRKAKVLGISDSKIVDVARISVCLPNLITLDEVSVLICDLNQGFDLIIGMDIILLGDFCISNGDGKTLFSFAMPPFENKTDFYEKSLGNT
jgi:hypothetical protein